MYHVRDAVSGNSSGERDARGWHLSSRVARANNARDKAELIELVVVVSCRRRVVVKREKKKKQKNKEKKGRINSGDTSQFAVHGGVGSARGAAGAGGPFCLAGCGLPFPVRGVLNGVGLHVWAELPSCI